MDVLLISIITSATISFLMMKFHIRMIERWMDEFFEEETRRIKKLLG